MTAGFALTTEPVVVLSPVAGDQEYEVAPLAVSVAELAEQIVAEGEAAMVTTGGVKVLTVTVCV